MSERRKITVRRVGEQNEYTMKTERRKPASKAYARGVRRAELEWIGERIQAFSQQVSKKNYGGTS